MNKCIMKKFDLKKLILASVIMGLVIAIPLGVITIFIRRTHDMELIYSILQMSLIMNFVVIASPFVFRYASKGKKEE